jgi:hypothetical protein
MKGEITYCSVNKQQATSNKQPATSNRQLELISKLNNYNHGKN